MKRIVVWIIILTALMLTTGCPPAAVAPEEEAPVVDEEIIIGVANLTMAAPYFLGMSRAAEEEAAHFENVTLIATDAGGDAGKLVSDIEDLIAKGADGILISGGWLEALPAGLEAIEKAGIPVVMVDRLLKGGNYTSWIGPDNYSIGVQVGQYLVDRLGGEGVLLVLRGGPADNTIGLARTEGVLSVVENTNIEVVKAPDFAGWSEDGAYPIMEDMLVKHDRIDAVFAENDSMALGAQRAIEVAGRSDEILLFGVDGQKEALKAILDGTNFAATGKNDSDEIGRAGFHRLMAILAGVKPEKDTILPSPLINIDNAARFYDPEALF